MARARQGSRHHAARRVDGRLGRNRASRLPLPGMLVVLVPAVACGALAMRMTHDGMPAQERDAEVAATSSPNVIDTGERPGDATPAESAPVDTAPDPRDAEYAVGPARTDWVFAAGDQKTVHLTLDDGSPANAQPVPDILERFGIKATFFVTGISPGHLPMVKERYSRGHITGLHTWPHDCAQVNASKEAYRSDLDAIGNAVREQMGYVPCFVRFPGGSSNAVSVSYARGVMTELSHEVVERGCQYYDWDTSCGDGAEHTAAELVEATMWDNSYGCTSIVFLMHDGAGQQTTVEALPTIIECFQGEGYAIAPIDRTTCVPHHGLAGH